MTEQRYRSMARPRIHPRLPKLHSGRTTDLEAGIIDKVTIRLGGGSLVVKSLEDLRAYLNLVSNSDTQVFRRGQGNAQNVLEVTGGWLFSGNIRYYPGRMTPFGQIVRYKAEFNLNFSRFLAQCPSSSNRRFRTSTQFLRLNQEVSANLRERSLDGQDNYLEESQFRAVHRTGNLTFSLDRYLRMVRQLVEEELSLPLIDSPTFEELRRVRDNAAFDWNVVRANDFTSCVVPYSEVYWERWSTDALNEIKRVERLIAPTSRKVRRALYEISSRANPRIRPRSRDLNSLSFSIDTGRTGIELCAYAKQWQRSRFEVRYKGTLRKYLNDLPEFEGLQSWDVYVGRLLNAATEDAAARIQVFLNEIQLDRDDEPVGMAHLFDAFRHVLNVCDGDQELAMEVMTIIVQVGGITHPTSGRRLSEEQGDREVQIRAAIDLLIGKGVLKKSGTQPRGSRTRTYVLSPSFLRSVQAMVD